MVRTIDKFPLCVKENGTTTYVVLRWIGVLRFFRNPRPWPCIFTLNGMFSNLSSIKHPVSRSPAGFEAELRNIRYIVIYAAFDSMCTTCCGKGISIPFSSKASLILRVRSNFTPQ